MSPVTLVGEVCVRCVEEGVMPPRPADAGGLCSPCSRLLGDRGRRLWRIWHDVDAEAA